MKIRSGFVSNSSSSSFICKVCGTLEGGYNVSLQDCGMERCQAGHTFCQCHMTGKTTSSFEERKEWARDSVKAHKYKSQESKDRIISRINSAFDDDELDEVVAEEIDGVSPHKCPICSFESVDADDLFCWYLKKNGLTVEQLASSLKREFGSYPKFKEFLTVTTPSKP